MQDKTNALTWADSERLMKAGDRRGERPTGIFVCKN